jgi:hypothetical protein
LDNFGLDKRIGDPNIIATSIACVSNQQAGFCRRETKGAEPRLYITHRELHPPVVLDEGFSLATEVDALWASTFGRWHTYGVACLSALAGAAHRNSFGIWLTDPRATKRAENPSGSVGAATGVGRRFLIELESGKPSCQRGRSLLVAGALGLCGARAEPKDFAFHWHWLGANKLCASDQRAEC